MVPSRVQTGMHMRLHGSKETVLGKGDVYSAYTTADMPEGEDQVGTR
jgi:hypothetical protein